MSLLWLIVVVATLYFYFVEKTLNSPLQKLADALGAVTERKVKVDGYNLTLESTETRELAVIKRRTRAVVKYESSWLGSRKLLIVQGIFMVRAGFDLSEFEGFEVQGNKVIGDWPEPRVLSVDLQDYEIFFSSDGVLNKIEDEDYERVVNLLNQQARRDAILKSDILEEAEWIVQTRLEDLTGGELEFKGRTTAP